MLYVSGIDSGNSTFGSGDQPDKPTDPDPDKPKKP